MLALIVVLTTAARPTSPSTSPTRPSLGSKPMARRRSQAPARASRVLPAATPAAVTSGSAAMAFAARAPAKIPGHAQYPSRSTAARATPVGGHTGVTCSVRNAMLSPSSAEAK